MTSLCLCGIHKTSKCHSCFNPFPHDKILYQTKLKAFADDKLNITRMIISVFDRVENIVEKGEIACTSNLSFSHDFFKRLLFQISQKASLCGYGLTCSQTSPCFYVYAVMVLWRHGGKKKLLVTSNFSFSHSVFYLFGEVSCHFYQI